MGFNKVLHIYTQVTYIHQVLWCYCDGLYHLQTGIIGCLVEADLLSWRWEISFLSIFYKKWIPVCVCVFVCVFVCEQKRLHIDGWLVTAFYTISRSIWWWTICIATVQLTIDWNADNWQLGLPCICRHIKILVCVKCVCVCVRVCVCVCGVCICNTSPFHAMVRVYLDGVSTHSNCKTDSSMASSPSDSPKVRGIGGPM